MDIKLLFNKIKIFLLNIPETLQETFSWFIMSYLVSIINIGIIWGINSNFSININILNIILVTNAGFLTSLFFLTYSLEKKRKFIYTLTIITYVITIVLFTISIVQIEIVKNIFSLNVYTISVILTFLISILLGLISKYDEVAALSKIRAKEAKGLSQTELAGKKVAL